MLLLAAASTGAAPAYARAPVTAPTTADSGDNNKM